MNESRNDLINDLVANLEPVQRPADTRRPLAFWLASALLYGVAIVLATGELRDGAIAALLSTPRFALEIATALVAIALLGHAALRSGIPDERSWRRRLTAPSIAFAAWVAFYVVAAAQGAEPAPMLGKREHCFLQTLLFSLPSFALLLWYVRALLPLWPRATAALAGAAAAAIPGALMQFACMYDPAHALALHLSPIALLAAFGAVAGGRVLARAPAIRI